MDANTKLNSKWNLWYHCEKDNWKISGFKKVHEIETIGDFWRLHNNWNKIKGINSKHFFFMKDGVYPIWEDPINLNGGCWSYEVHEDQSEYLWNDLASYLVCEEIISNVDEVVGLSICLKKNNKSDIKIWNTNSKNNSLSQINKNIIKKWGIDIIYIVHMVNNF
jgi:hypothetical protein